MKARNLREEMNVFNTMFSDMVDKYGISVEDHMTLYGATLMFIQAALEANEVPEN